MLGKSELMACVQRFMGAFNDGRMDEWASFFSADVRVAVNDTTVATSRTEFLRVATAMREQGFIAEFLTSLAVSGNVVTCHYLNRYRDGSTTEGGVLLRFDGSGLVADQRVLPSVTGPSVSDAELLATWWTMLEAIAARDRPELVQALSPGFNAVIDEASYPDPTSFADALWAARPAGSGQPFALVVRGGVLTAHQSLLANRVDDAPGGLLATFDEHGKVLRIRTLAATALQQ